MRKLILISALLLASASAQAGERILSLNGAGTTATDSTRQPSPPAAQSDQATPQANEPAAQPRSPKPRSQARSYDDDEAKARRIAAKYGISW